MLLTPTSRRRATYKAAKARLELRLAQRNAAKDEPLYSDEKWQEILTGCRRLVADALQRLIEWTGKEED